MAEGQGDVAPFYREAHIDFVRNLDTKGEKVFCCEPFLSVADERGR